MPERASPHVADDPTGLGRRYAPIRDYAVVGDCHGAALVARDGGVDWCCFRRFDADPVFCRLLDAERGGALAVTPVGPYQVQREYLDGTNVLRTVFSTRSGRVALIDFMPVGRAPGSGVHDYTDLCAPGWFVRVVEVLEGQVELRVLHRPTPGFARGRNRLVEVHGAIVGQRGTTLYTDGALELRQDHALGTWRLEAGERRHLIVAARPEDGPVDVASRVAELYSVTRAFWSEWLGYCRYDGDYAPFVRRSALALKLLTYSPSGAIVAAPTTSLPEWIGGERNWDYRYCWIRDATFTLYALAALGYSGEARAFDRFLETCSERSGAGLQAIYGIEHETGLDEHCLEHLAGYAGSRPVRVGNAAYSQRQLDVYGAILDWAHLHRALGGRLDRATRRVLRAEAQFVAARWREPGNGIWEMRGGRRQHVFGKVMSWVALDRALQLLGHDADLARERDQVLRAIVEQGVHPRGHLTQVLGGDESDAALLLAPMLGLPLDEAVFSATVDEVQRTLGWGDYVRRYRSSDGLRGDEGAFLTCSFWLVDALLAVDRGHEARALFERLLECANDVGLYSEEVDPETHAFLGNFPQALTHLALVQSATNLSLYEDGGAAALRGTYADRARHRVVATSGPRALWTAFKHSGRVGRLRSSRDSMLRRREVPQD